MTTLKTVTIAAVLLAAGTSLAMAQYGGWYPGYGNDYVTPVADLAPPAHGYAAPAPVYAAPAYAARATAGTTIVIVTPGAPAYAAPPVVGSGYYNYAPGYWGGYGYGWR